MNNSPIGFFDSGVGQLSVLIEAKKLLPRENFVIFADQGNNPYGDKTPVQIKRYTTYATEFLIKKHNIKMMILACNTATVLAIDHLRRNFKIPIVGAVPAVKPAFKNGSKVAILSTSATAKSKYLVDLVNDFGSKDSTLKIGCVGLEEAIEILDYKKIEKLLKKYLVKVKKFKADVVVLGCTHYPLVKSQIQAVLGKNVKVIDSGQAITKRAKQLLLENRLLSQSKKGDLFYTTGNWKQFSKIASILLKQPIKATKAN